MRINILKIIMLVLFLSLISSNTFAIRIKIATLSPEGSKWMQKMREGAEAVEKKTEKRVRFKFYPGGVMGSDKAVLRKIRIGQLHGGAVVAGSLAGYNRDNQIYGMPLKFRSEKEIDYVRERMDQHILKGLEKGGFVTFGIAEGGFAYIMSNNPVQTLGDVRKQKVWVPDNDIAILAAVKAFGITPTPLPLADVRAGLQTGLIDTVTTSPLGAVVLQWHTQIKYLMDVPFLYIYAVLSVDEKIFKKISPDDQKIVREEMGRAFSDLDKLNRQDNIKAMEALRKQGVQFIKPSNDAMQEWYKKAETAAGQMIGDDKISPEAAKILKGHLKDYRSKHAEK